MMEEKEAPIIGTESFPPLGERLQEARLKKKLSEVEVAKQLRISKDIIVYMENQQWDKLPARTYARGYFANYVKFLGLPHDEMLALFNMEYTETDRVLDLKSYGAKTRANSFPFGGLLVVVLLAVTVWFAYQEWQKSLEQPTEPVPAEEQQNTLPESDFNSSIVTPIDEKEPALASSEQQDSELEQEQIESSSLAANIPSVSSGVVEIQPEQNDEVTDTTQLQNSQGQLTVSFSDECWVEVTDSSSHILVSKIMNANQILKLESALPFKVLLGKASAATLSFNGSQVDLNPYIQGDVARLTLGADS